MLFRQIFDPKLAQYAYLVGCQQTGEALLVDPERDVDRYLHAADVEGLRIVAVAETHIHADFLSGARELAARHGVRVYLSGEGGPAWASPWAKRKRADGSPYDAHVLKDGDTFRVGRIEIRALHTPGHTPEHLSYLITDRGAGAVDPIGVVTGDFVFVGDLGRPDLLERAAGMHGAQESSARELFRSIPKFTALDDYLQVWPGHGAGSTCGRELGAVPQSTVGYEKRYNASLAAADRGEDAFVDAILHGQPDPQTYFARMKRQNNDGVPLLGELPVPKRLLVEELGAVVAEGKLLPVDGRRDRAAFMARHLPSALHSPMTKNFNTVVGSLVEDEATPLLLIIESDEVEEAVRDLVRIGFDRVEAFAVPGTLDCHFDEGGASATIERVTFADLAQEEAPEDVVFVDVRFASEFAAGHLPGAINASYTRLPSYARERIPMGRTLLVHCSTGRRAAAAAAFLAREGFQVKLVDDDFPNATRVDELVTP
jgi:hydroxyacylglutathione hydrolase